MPAEPTGDLEGAPLNPSTPPPSISAHDRWLWPRIVRILDEAGIALVYKPNLRDKGKTKRD